MNIQDLLPPLRLDRRRHAAPQVFERLRELIVALDLVPGTVLPPNELAEAFGVSRTPVRDALLRLEEEGLVDIFPQHATMVSRISIPSARQAHFLRLAIELEIVHTLSQRGDEGLVARLQRYIDRQRAALAAADYTAFIATDHSFHREMHEAAGVGELWDMAQRVSGHVDRLRRLHLPEQGKAERVLADHQAIVDAVAARDPALAQRRLREHLSGTLSQIETICARYPNYVIVGEDRP